MTDEKEFSLGEPALVCRWRMVARKIPMLNRHMRALSQRTVAGAPLTQNLLSWVKQHIEWSLAEDTSVEPDGVLMLVVDVDGHAAMSVGPYEPLDHPTADMLAHRAVEAHLEASSTGIAPEVVCVAGKDGIVVIATPDEARSGAMTLVEQLAHTRGYQVEYKPDFELAPGSAEFLVSDEHGVVPLDQDARTAAADDPSGLIGFLTESYQTLLDRTKEGRR